MDIRKIIKEIIEEDLFSEDYPQSFDMEQFKSLTSFAARIRYCEEHLQRIASGSARIVYKIDDEKVLKLAKNKKGLAQNEVEIDQGSQGYLEDVVARVFESHKDNLWVEMELAKKINKEAFKKVTGYNFKDYVAAIHNYPLRNKRPSRYDVFYPEDKELTQEMWEDEFVYSIFNYIGGYEVPTGDLERLNSYGIVERDGEETIVLIDFGANQEVIDTYYSVN